VVRRTKDGTRRFICLVFLRGIRERAGDTWYPYRHHHLIEAKQSDETNKREGMRAPSLSHPRSPYSLPLRYRASSRLHRAAVSITARSCKPSRVPPPWPSSPSVLLFRSWEIEYLCKLNEGGIDGRRRMGDRRVR